MVRGENQISKERQGWGFREAVGHWRESAAESSHRQIGPLNPYHDPATAVSADTATLTLLLM